MLWYIRKFKDAYLVLLCGKLLENLLTRMKMKTLTKFVEVRLFKIFLKLPGYKLCFWKEMYTCELYVVFNNIPCVISRWSPDLVSVVFVTMESNPGQCPFTLDDAFFPTAHGGKKFLDCVWVRLLPMGPRDHMQERSYLTHFLCCLSGERKTLRVWVRLLSIGPRVCIPERTISCQLWMGWSPNRSMW